jgi:hypothetical protein
MILFDRKKALSQILGPPPEEIREEIDPAHALAEEAMRAFEGKDAKGFAEATKAMFLHFSNSGAEAGPDIPQD